MTLLVNLLTKFTRMSVGGKGDATSCINTIKLKKSSSGKDWLTLGISLCSSASNRTQNWLSHSPSTVIYCCDRCDCVFQGNVADDLTSNMIVVLSEKLAGGRVSIFLD